MYVITEFLEKLIHSLNKYLIPIGEFSEPVSSWKLSPHSGPHLYIIKGISHTVSHLYDIKVIYSLTNGSGTTALKIIIVK